MNDVATEIRASRIPKACWPFVWALCNGEGGTDSMAWVRCYGGGIYSGPMTAVFNSAQPLWPGKQGPAGISHALGAAQFEPGTYEETAKITGLADIQPQSQLANAWQLLQDRYKAATGGIFEVDVMAGKYMQIADALKKTWTSLANPSKFQKHYSEAQSVFSAIPAPTPTPIPTPVDPEVAAIAVIVQQLVPLAADARMRVISYVRSRFGL